MESTKEQVLHLLQQGTGTTVADLSRKLGVGEASIRRHLDHLRLEGLADARVERHGVGRPSYVFYATAEAEERTPGGYSRLVSRLLASLQSLSSEQLKGIAGEELLSEAFDSVAHQVAEVHRDEVDGATIEQRVAQTSRALKREGILDRWVSAEDGYHLENVACPYKQAALTSRAPCESDRRVIELLVAAPVEQVSRIADGQSVCEYIVSHRTKNEGEERE
jgi:predicted ArsR family transcriptional regulator